MSKESQIRHEANNPSVGGGLNNEQVHLAGRLGMDLIRQNSVVYFGDMVSSALTHNKYLTEAEQREAAHGDVVIAGVALGAAAGNPDRHMLTIHGGPLTDILRRSGMSGPGMAFIADALHHINQKPGNVSVAADVMYGAERLAEAHEREGEDMTLFKSAIFAMGFTATKDVHLGGAMFDRVQKQVN